MSLTQTLMNGGMIGTSINPAKYNHDNGALRIATESVEELHDIFMTTFYATEQAELGAVHEGVALENSSYAAVYEGAVADAFTKVKEFFKKLWDKVKAWFHNVKRFFESLFMSGKDFVKKYKNDINKATNLKDFEFKMFEYNNALIDSADKNYDVDSHSQDFFDKAEAVYSDKNGYKQYDDIKKQLEHDALVKEYGSQILNGNTVNDTEEFNDACYAIFRNKTGKIAAMTKDDKETVDVTDLSTYAAILENAGNIKSAIDSMARKTDKAYSNAIKRINDFEKENRAKKFDTIDQTEKNKYEIKDDQGNGTGKYDEDAFKEAGKNVSKVLNAVSSAMSTVQGLHNTYMNSWKTVVKERDTVYKQLIVAGLSNDRKNKKNK